MISAEGGATAAARHLPGAAEPKGGFLPARVCGRWRAGPLLALQTAALLRSCAEELKDSCCKYEGS